MTSSRPRKWQFPRNDVPSWGVATVLFLICICLFMLMVGAGYQLMIERIGDFTGWQLPFFLVMGAVLIGSIAFFVSSTKSAIDRHKQRKGNHGSDG